MFCLSYKEITKKFYVRFFVISMDIYLKFVRYSPPVWPLFGHIYWEANVLSHEFSSAAELFHILFTLYLHLTRREQNWFVNQHTCKTFLLYLLFCTCCSKQTKIISEHGSAWVYVLLGKFWAMVRWFGWKIRKVKENKDKIILEFTDWISVSHSQ